MTNTSILGLLALGFIGFRAIANVRTANSLQITFGDVAASFQGLNLDLKIKLNITNPTGNPIDITGITGTATLGNQVKGNVSYAGRTTFAATTTTALWVPVVFNVMEVTKLLGLVRPIKLDLNLLVSTPTLQIPIQETTTVL